MMLKPLTLAAVILIAATCTFTQRVAVLAPDSSDLSRRLSPLFEKALQETCELIDSDIARSAFESSKFDAPYNLTTEQTRQAGRAIGGDFFVLIRSGVQRRSSFERQEYYEATLAVFLVSTRTGRLVNFRTLVVKEDRPEAAIERLARSAPEIGMALGVIAKQVLKSELAEEAPPRMESVPEDGSPLADNFRAPVPFRRIKPAYTQRAGDFDVTATVEMSVDLDENGKVLRTEATRWAGFDLEGSVDQAVRQMNWRPAERDGKFIPMRFAVRYNFKRPEKAK